MVLLPRPPTLAPCPPSRRPFAPPATAATLRGLFAGSGIAAMSDRHICKSVIGLLGRGDDDPLRPSRDRPSLLYLGTASYDLPGPRERQTRAFEDLGVRVNSLDVANHRVPRDEMEGMVNGADIILISGGNTLYAVDRWKRLGLDKLLRDAAFEGKVMAGGSAGAICWFDGGHSDSADPASYRLSKLKANEAESDEKEEKKGDENEIKADIDPSNDWEYIRVDGLGIWPGLICPHYDQTQSNGVLRMTDFDSMMKRHPYELGIGIDHYAALEVNGDDFRILSVPGEIGSVPSRIGEDADEECNGSMNSGNVPGAWIKYVDEKGTLHSMVCPRSGKVSELLQFVKEPNEHLVLDERVELCRKENPLVMD